MNTRLGLEQLEGKDCPSPINIAIDPSGNMSATGEAYGSLDLSFITPARYATTQGADELGLQANTTGGGSGRASMGLGVNGMSVEGSEVIGGNLSYTGGSKDDNLTALDGIVGGSVALTLGDGRNTVSFGA